MLHGKCTLKITIVANTFNNKLQEICNWFKANKLSVNASKTNYMVLGTHNSTAKFIDCNKVNNTTNVSQSNNYSHTEKVKIDIVLDNVSLDRVNSTKFLGVVIDENVTWKKHIDAISKTISRNVGMLKTLRT